MKEDTLIKTIFVCIGLSAAAFFIFYILPVWRTNFVLERAAKSGVITENDGWDRPIFLHVETRKEGIFRFARSLGRDGVESEDNLGFMAVDWNKSGIIGEFVGAKVKEAGKGFWRGILKPSEFKESK